MSSLRDDDELLGFTDGRLAAGFVLRGLRRHGGLAAGVFGLGVAATVAAFLALPRTYHTEVKLLAQRNLVMPALGNPRRTVPADSDAPTRLAAETVMKRDNLISVIRATRLIEEWDRTRASVLKLKDRMLRPVVGAPTEEDKLEALIGTLRKKVYVLADEGTVTIGIDWPDAAMAGRIAERMQQNFLEERHASEVSSIADAISILEGHAAAVRATIESAAAEVRRSPAIAPASARARPRAPVAPPSRAPAAAASDPAVVPLQVLLEAKQRAIADLEEFRQRRLTELHTLLAEQQKTYGPSHPAIADTQRSIEAVSGESPQIDALKQEEADLLAQIRRRGGSGTAVAAPVADGSARPAVASSMSAAPAGRREPAAEPLPGYAQSRLKSATAEYEDLLERLEGARIELDTARAAFKYRYGVISPAQAPKRPIRPGPAFLAIGLILALLSAVAAAVLADLGRGRIVESWQVERFLGLEVRGEVSRP
jgi:uncharacterized protein involved in exopolysaccharide biosynthesis